LGCFHLEGQARKSLWIETDKGWNIGCAKIGQARKSLWIETHSILLSEEEEQGQARKSLWIETVWFFSSRYNEAVRLVRACGSKQPETPEDILASIGQARKSLWIET